MSFRRLFWKLAASPPVRMISIWYSERKLSKWRRQHPGAPFANFYAERITDKLQRGRCHTTLGARGWVVGDDRPVEWNLELFARRALKRWDEIVGFGLKPNMRCVDYGCGSLRLGQHAMRYLDAGNYWGIDVTDAFIKTGLELVNPELLARKAPRLSTINGQVLRDIRSWQPDFIFSNAVLQHVPPEELGLFFERLEAMMAPHTTAFILYITGEQVLRFDAMSWGYPAEYIRAAALSAAPSLEILERKVYHGRRGDGRDREVLILEGGGVRSNSARPVPAQLFG
jgi:hypothetical protein